MQQCKLYLMQGKEKNITFQEYIQENFPFVCELPKSVFYDGYSSSFNAYTCAMPNWLNS